jgi:thiamine kinase-like enzyme
MTLAECLTTQIAPRCSILQLTRTPSPYHSSFVIEDLKITFDDSTQLEIVFKNLSKDGLLPEARRTKPEFVYDPIREIRVYDRILAGAGLGTAVCYGSLVQPVQGDYWLFLEKIRGLELYQVGEFSVWQRTAKWLARLHQKLKVDRETALDCHLLQYDADFYRSWLTRALQFCPKPEISWIAERYDRVIERLIELPSTFIHGEFYASNIIVMESEDGWRIAPIDWEMAAIAPSLMDLAGLTAGKWRDEQRRELAMAYRSELSTNDVQLESVDEFLESIEYCRLHQCVQWLGWASNWSPPQEHTHDWFREAISIAERLCL